MNAVLELQKLTHDTDGKGPAVEVTPTITTVVGNSTISIKCK